MSNLKTIKAKVAKKLKLKKEEIGEFQEIKEDKTNKIKTEEQESFAKNILTGKS